MITPTPKSSKDTSSLLLTPFRGFRLEGFSLIELFQSHLFGDALRSDSLEVAKQFILSLKDLPEVIITNLREYKEREKAISQTEVALLDESDKFPQNIGSTFKFMCISLSDQRYYMAKNLSWIDALNRRDQAEKRTH